MSGPGLGRRRVPLATSCGKVTNCIFGDKNQLYHQSQGLAELFGKVLAWDGGSRGPWEGSYKGS